MSDFHFKHIIPQNVDFLKSLSMKNNACFAQTLAQNLCTLESSSYRPTKQKERDERNCWPKRQTCCRFSSSRSSHRRQ